MSSKSRSRRGFRKVPQQHADETLAARFERDDVLPVGQNDPRDRDLELEFPGDLRVNHLNEVARHIGGQDFRMHIALAADGGSVLLIDSCTPAFAFEATD